MFEIGGYNVRIANRNALQDHTVKHFCRWYRIFPIITVNNSLHIEGKIVQMSDNIEKKKKWPPYSASSSKFVMAARKIYFTDYYFGPMYE